MILKTKLLFQDYLSLIFIMTYRKPLVIFSTCCGLIMFFGSVLYFLGFKIPVDNPPYWQLILGFFIVFITPFSIYFGARKNYFSNKRIHESITYEISADKLKITGESFSSELDWFKTYKVIELRNWILIYQDRIVANLIPKSCFGSELKDFKNLVISKKIIKTNFSLIRKAFDTVKMLLPLLFFLLIALVFVFSTAEPEIYIVPNNYSGEVLVFFDQSDGIQQQMDDGRRLYQIPENGILFTKSKWNPGSHNYRFYMLIDNKRVEIDEVNSNYVYTNNNDSDKYSVINMKPYYFKDSDNKKYLFRATRFIIGKRKDFDKYNVEVKTDSIIETVFSNK